MRPQLRARAAGQGGVFTRRQAVECGYTERELKTLTGHRGRWVVVRRGCYAERGLWEALDDDGRYLLRVRAAALNAHREAVVSHTAAAVVHRLPVRPRWRELVHVTRSDARGSRTEGGVKHHPGLLPGHDVVTVEGMRVTSLARTAVDVAREHGFEDGVVAADAARRLGVTRGQLDAVLLGMASWPYVTVARAAVDVSDGGAQTIGETLLRLVVLELGLGLPQTQFLVSERDRWAEVDLRLGRHLFEFDGQVKYRGREQGGVADSPPEEVVWREKRREDWIRRSNGGFGMSRVVWSELFGEARARTVHRLRAEVMETWRRFGDAMWDVPAPQERAEAAPSSRAVWTPRGG
jgi:hypothetical protein